MFCLNISDTCDLFRKIFNYFHLTMGTIKWWTRGTLFFFRQWGYNMLCPPHFLFSLRNILVSHQPAPPHFTTKLRPCTWTMYKLKGSDLGGNVSQQTSCGRNLGLSQNKRKKTFRWIFIFFIYTRYPLPLMLNMW